MTTDEILNELKGEHAKSEIINKLDENITVSSYLNKLLVEHNAQISKLVRELGYDRCYVYQFFSGKREPTRTFLLRYAVLLSLSLEETQRLLTIGGKSILYPRIKRDAAIIYIIEHKTGVKEANDFLEKMGVRALF